MKILISGAGIAGLALAGFLQKHTVHVDIIDRSPAFTHMGYGILMWPNGIRILNKLGIGEAITQSSCAIDKMVMIDHLGTHLQTEDLRTISSQFGSVYTVERESLHIHLQKLVLQRSITFGTTISSFFQHDHKVNVTLSSGAQKTYDLLVSADGVRSSIRKKIFDIDPSYYNFSVWIDFIEKGVDLPSDARLIIGKGSYIFCFPVSGNRHVAYFFVKHNSDMSHKKEDDKGPAEYFKDFKGIGKKIVDHISKPEHMYRDDIRKVRLEDWYRKRVVLAGDAEHAMTPISGLGSSMALEDAFVLYDELLAVDFEGARVSEALERYAKRRQPRVKAVETFSDALMNLSVKNTFLATVRNTLLTQDFSRQFIENGIRKALEYDI